MQKKSTQATIAAPTAMPGTKPAANEVPEKPGVAVTDAVLAPVDATAVGVIDITVAPCTAVGVEFDPGTAVSEVFCALPVEFDVAASAALTKIQALPFWHVYPCGQQLWPQVWRFVGGADWYWPLGTKVAFCDGRSHAMGAIA